MLANSTVDIQTQLPQQAYWLLDVTPIAMNFNILSIFLSESLQ